MDAYKDLKATELFCDRCKTAVPVREKLLLIIPGKNLYDYICTRCGKSLGKRTEPDAGNMKVKMMDLRALRGRKA